MKRTLSIILSLVLMLTAFSCLNVSAASWPSLSSSAYCEFTATKNINVYRNTSLSTRGTSSPAKSYNAYIEKNDVCRIYKITSSYVKISYPTSSGYKQGYIKRTDLFSVSSPSETFTSQGKATTYKYAGSSSYGYVAANDKVYNAGKSGSYNYIIYTAKSGSRAYKAGYISTSDYNKINKTTTNKTSSTSKNTYTNKTSSISLNVPLYKQNDSRWKNEYIGNKTIGNIGCTTTAIAMVYSYNTNTTVYPHEVKKKLQYSNNDLKWSSISKVGLSSKSYNSNVTQSMLSTIYSKLKSGKPVIIGATTSSGGSQHWVVITGYTGSNTSSFSTSDFAVNDPGTQCSTTLSQFLANGSKADRTKIKRIIY